MVKNKFILYNKYISKKKRNNIHIFFIFLNGKIRINTFHRFKIKRNNSMLID